jgi:MEDS: MEthanogen/methylotroph, DcmR Sensory domain
MLKHLRYDLPTIIILLFVYCLYEYSLGGEMARILTKKCHVNDVLNHMNEADYGAHYLIIYPDLVTLRELYSNYTQRQIKDNNEIVLITPFYETTNSVRQVLSQYNHGVDLSKHEKEESLVIVDALEEYLGDQPLVHLKKGIGGYSKMGKKGFSALADMGAYPHKFKYKDLVDYELSLPTKYDEQVRGFCLYHQKDFDRFSEEQKQRLIEHHGKALKIIHTE